MRNVCVILLLLSLLTVSCRRERVQFEAKERIVSLDMRGDSTGRWLECLEEDGQAVKLPTRFIGRYDELFNDSNLRHWEGARPIGIEPLSDLRSHWRIRRPLVKIASCEDFYVEQLTFSRPYLVPEAAAMLHEIGRRFRDSLESRGGGDYRIRVTSVLRTPANVRRLRRSNGNAVDSSVHQLGTTIDISYNSFAVDSHRIPRSSADLKSILAEVLNAMRSEGKCLVKYEKKQPCFHVSAIKRQ